MKKRDVKAKAKQDVAVVKDTKKNIITVTTSAAGGILVDHLNPDCKSFSVIHHEGKALSCYLMWSDIKDNHNKYYISQGLVDTKGQHYLWTRYGRVGLNGVGSNLPCHSEDNLKSQYSKK